MWIIVSWSVSGSSFFLGFLRSAACYHSLFPWQWQLFLSQLCSACACECECECEAKRQVWCLISMGLYTMATPQVIECGTLEYGSVVINILTINLEWIYSNDQFFFLLVTKSFEEGGYPILRLGHINVFLRTYIGSFNSIFGFYSLLTKKDCWQ